MVGPSNYNYTGNKLRDMIKIKKHKLTKPSDGTCFDTTPESNWNNGRMELSEKCSLLFVFKIITEYFLFILFRSNTDLQNWIKRTSRNDVYSYPIDKNEFYGISSMQDEPTLY